MPKIGCSNALERLVDPVEAHEPRDRGRLAARDDQPVEPVELLGLRTSTTSAPSRRSTARVLAEVALEGEDADSQLRQLEL